MELIAQGAEAKLYKEGDQLIKERVSKGYRVPEIDKKLIKRRTKREAKVLKDLEKLGFTPKLIDNDGTKIVMEFIKGKVDTVSSKMGLMHNLVGGLVEKFVFGKLSSELEKKVGKKKTAKKKTSRKKK